MNRSVLFISHRLGEVLNICDIATILRNGRDVANFSLDGVDEAELVSRCSVRALPGSLLPPNPKISAVHVGRRSERDRAARPSTCTSGARSTGSRSISSEGEVLGVTALEGQGQDELFSLLSGDHRPTTGEILVNGESMRARSPYDAIRKGLVFVPGDRQEALFPQRSVRENLAIPLYNRFTRWFRLQTGRRRASWCRDPTPRHRHQGREPGPAAFRGQSPESHDRTMADRRLRGSAVFRSDTRYRHPDQGPDLRHPQGGRGQRGCRVVVFERTS